MVDMLLLRLLMGSSIPVCIHYVLILTCSHHGIVVIILQVYLGLATSLLAYVYQLLIDLRKPYTQLIIEKSPNCRLMNKDAIRETDASAVIILLQGLKHCMSDVSLTLRAMLAVSSGVVALNIWPEYLACSPAVILYIC